MVDVSREGNEQFVGERHDRDAAGAGRSAVPARKLNPQHLRPGRDQPTSSGSKRFAIDSPLEGERFELSVPI